MIRKTDSTTLPAAAPATGEAQLKAKLEARVIGSGPAVRGIADAIVKGAPKSPAHSVKVVTPGEVGKSRLIDVMTQEMGGPEGSARLLTLMSKANIQTARGEWNETTAKMYALLAAHHEDRETTIREFHTGVTGNPTS